MKTAVKQLIEILERQSSDAQEQFASDFIAHIDQWEHLRSEVQIGIDAAKRGEVSPMQTSDQLLARMHSRHGVA